MSQADNWGSQAKLFTLTTRSPTDDYAEDALKLSGIENRKSENIKVFDNGCGSGSIAVMIAKSFPNSQVIGGDFAQQMVDACKKRIQEENLNNITAEVQDGVNLTLPSNEFDYVFCQFTVMFFPDYKKGFEEMYRVTKEGGMCVITTWNANTIMNLMVDARKKVSEYTSNHDKQGHGAYFKDPERLIQFAKNAGFKTAEVTSTSHVWHFTLQQLEHFNTNPGFLEVAKDLDEEGKKKFFDEFIQNAKQRLDDKGVKLDTTANILIATK
jgi:ubiquinone/menaquinone biosynthesis C-methylase UbiE